MKSGEISLGTKLTYMYINTYTYRYPRLHTYWDTHVVNSVHFRRSLPLRYSNHIPTVGDQISLLGTPFGSFCPEVFLGSLSVGCVSKLLGREGEVFVSDARCLPGCEGAMVLCGAHRDIRCVLPWL